MMSSPNLDAVPNDTWTALALNAPEALGLTFSEQASIFGEECSTTDEYEALKLRFSQSFNPEYRDRTNKLVDITVCLDCLFQTDEQKAVWVNRVDDDLGGKTPKELLLSGDPRNIDRVLGMLEVVVGAR